MSLSGRAASLLLLIWLSHRHSGLMCWLRRLAKPLAAATQYEGFKRQYLDTANTCSSQGITFIPLVAEVTGGWGPTGLKTISKLANRTAHTTEQSTSMVFTHLLESLCVAIRRANAQAVLK